MKSEILDSQRTQQVVNHIRAKIEDGTLQPGDKIPPEREFAKSLNISRASLRTGIGYLAALGVMKVRHGVGTFVADGPAEFGKASLGLLGALHGFKSWQMFEARKLLETNLAALAAERGTEEHLTQLAEEVTEMYATADDPAQYLIHDVRFHRTIAQASGNPILAALMETVTTALYDERRKTAERAKDRRPSLEAHRDIYRAIRDGNPIEARRAMERHLHSAESELAAEQAARERGNVRPVRPKKKTA
ncbi:MAG: FadR/GntR family transcriptional regulator [Terracidiphilus sp.]|jgi:GntR family transcriptional repressor for pyruvate dehydrogenase complex